MVKSVCFYTTKPDFLWHLQEEFLFSTKKKRDKKAKKAKQAVLSDEDITELAGELGNEYKYHKNLSFAQFSRLYVSLVLAINGSFFTLLKFSVAKSM